MNIKYLNHIYEIQSEKLVKSPDRIFDEERVYIIIDKSINKIWIWAGTKTRLYQRYIAKNLASK